MINRGRIALLQDAAAIHDDDLVGEAHRLFLVVRDDERRAMRGLEDLLQLEAQLLP